MASSRNRPRADLPETVAEVLRQHLQPGERLALGLSGGVDSVVLLHVLVALRRTLSFDLSAVHVHHGISPNADAWEAFCRDLCQAWQVPLEVRRVAVERGSADGLEAAARRARYAAFAPIHADWLALAHQRDDQAETVLFNLLRGTGVAGAAAMRVADEMRGGTARRRILRPLLGVPRRSVEGYARNTGLDWISDESNGDSHFSRNFLRTEVLAPMKARFPGCDAALARAAGHFAEAEDLLDDLARLDAAGAVRGDRLDVQAIARLSDERARNLLRFFLKFRDVAAPSSARLKEVLRQLRTAGGDRQVRFPLGERMLLRYRGEMRIEPHLRAMPLRLPWRGEECVAWGVTSVHFTQATGAGISAEKLVRGEAFLRRRGGGERLQPDPRRPRRSLKNLFQEAGIPPQQRQAMPLLWCGEDLVWAPGIGVDCAYQCGPGEPGWLVEWILA